MMLTTATNKCGLQSALIVNNTVAKRESDDVNKKRQQTPDIGAREHDVLNASRTLGNRFLRDNARRFGASEDEPVSVGIRKRDRGPYKTGVIDRLERNARLVRRLTRAARSRASSTRICGVCQRCADHRAEFPNGDPEPPPQPVGGL